MAFDQSTRGRLQKFVTNCRVSLSEELTRQLQSLYGLDPSTGHVAELDELTHLDNRQRQTARLLREMLAHYDAATPGKDEAARTKQALDRIVREQAFTVLNRLAALRMAEARGFLIESIAQGQNSKGFQLYRSLAGTAHGETGDAYTSYLFSLFDEFALDMAVLFDRHSPQGRLFPREGTLLEVLEQINHPDIEHLWAEDETIGWIYQYFNSQEERKKMRKESQAPRNSRELAVRNQFFTPRYVVEFLVDNTLGRIWFDAAIGITSLYDRCQYLLVKPEELEQKRAEPTPRTLRDPRTLKLLDPACGSMHFGLYAFDLFLEIYREAWIWEQEKGPGSLDVSTEPDRGLKPLSQTYEDEVAYLRDVPRLIIEHNIFGVDIDPRAAQIATLALWLRAQRTWFEAGVKALQRPLISRGHIVAATAPPEEKGLREEFAEQLDEKDAVLFEKTLQLLHQLPELGVLLQIDQELPKLIKRIYGGGSQDLFAEEEQEIWQKADQRLGQALTAFAKDVSNTYQSQMFAADAIQGLRLIDMAREKFDVVVMNPPFGEPSRSTKKYLEESLPRSKGNILANFVERSTHLLREGGRVGAIISRTCFYLQSFSQFRRSVLSEDLHVEGFADLGLGVLDAMVETAAVTFRRDNVRDSEAVFFRELNQAEKQKGLLDSIGLLRNGAWGPNFFVRNVKQFSVFKDVPYVYWINQSVAKKIASVPSIEPEQCSIRVGLQTGDDFRFLRLWWEVKSGDLIVPQSNQDIDSICHESKKLSKSKKWAWYSKTESASPILSSIHLCVNWLENGREIKAYHVGNGHSASKYVMSESMYFRPGASYMLRSSRLVPYLVPAGVIPTAGRSQVYPKSGTEIWLSTLLASNLATAVARFRGEAFWQPKFQNSMVSSIPYIEPNAEVLDEAAQVISGIRHKISENFKNDESEIFFTIPNLGDDFKVKERINRESLIGESLDCRIAQLAGLTDDEYYSLLRDHNESLGKYEIKDVEDEFESSDITRSLQIDESPGSNFDRLSWAVGVAFGRFDIGLANDESRSPGEPKPFDPLPAKSPGMLSGGAEPYHSCAGILVDDESHRHDLPRLIEQVLGTINRQANQNIRRWLQKDFFPFHLQRYSKSRRKAPIYWPISTASGSYTVWIYYPALTNQTLFTAINDFVEPRLYSVRDDLNSLRSKGGSRSKQEEKDLEKLEGLEQELADLLDKLLEIAPDYRPDQNDGVQITAAPLWSLFRHTPWQKVLKDTWKQLGKGKYDWANLALNYWSDRVLRKCHADRSLAIAHDVEELFWDEVEVPVIRRGKDTGETKLEWQPKDLSDSELDELIKRTIEKRGLKSEFR